MTNEVSEILDIIHDLNNSNKIYIVRTIIESLGREDGLTALINLNSSLLDEFLVRYIVKRMDSLDNKIESIIETMRNKD